MTGRREAFIKSVPKVARYRYVNEQTGDAVDVTLPAPCDPALVRAIDAAMARTGYERSEGDAQ